MSDVTRRDALKLLAATGGAAACSRKQTPEEPVGVTPEASSSVNPILAVNALPPSPQPWPVPDPFLFCVHHDDAYPH